MTTQTWDQPKQCHRSPIGRGSGLKIRTVRVRISLVVPFYGLLAQRLVQTTHENRALSLETA